MSAQSPERSRLIRWTTHRGFIAIIIFLVVAALVELLVVSYAKGLDTIDETQLVWNFSLLFHLVPIAVIAALTFTWIFVTQNTTTKSPEAWKARTGQRVSRSEKAAPRRSNSVSRFVRKVRTTLARATIRSAFIVFFFFLVFVLVTSLLVYPQLIYRTVSELYRSNPSFLAFIKGADATLAPVGNALNGIFSGPASGFRDFAVGVGGILGFVANLDNDGKYLIFQNAAAWISALIGWTYVEFVLKNPKYRRVVFKRS